MPRNPNWMQLLTLRSSGAMGHHGDEKKYNRKKKHKKKNKRNNLHESKYSNPYSQVQELKNGQVIMNGLVKIKL